MSNVPPKRRWYQFSLKTLLIVTTLFTIGVGGIGSRMYRARRNRERVAAVEEAIDKAAAEFTWDGGVAFRQNYEERRPQTWLEKQFDDPGGADDPVGLLKVNVTFFTGPYGPAGTTDTSLEYLKGLTNLQYLYLWGTNVTDAGLEHLKGLTNLEVLDLDLTQVTNTGLEHLKGLTGLQFLYLDQTLVTDEGVRKLQQALPNCEIYHSPIIIREFSDSN